MIEYISTTTRTDRVRVREILADKDCTQRNTLDMGMELMSREQGRKGEAATRRGGSRPLRARLPPLGHDHKEAGAWRRVIVSSTPRKRGVVAAWMSPGGEGEGD